MGRWLKGLLITLLAPFVIVLVVLLVASGSKDWADKVLEWAER